MGIDNVGMAELGEALMAINSAHQHKPSLVERYPRRLVFRFYSGEFVVKSSGEALFSILYYMISAMNIAPNSNDEPSELLYELGSIMNAILYYIPNFKHDYVYHVYSDNIELWNDTADLWRTILRYTRKIALLIGIGNSTESIDVLISRYTLIDLDEQNVHE